MDILDKTVTIETSNGRYSDKNHVELFKLQRRFITLVCKELNISRKKFKKLYKSKKLEDANFKAEIDKQFIELKNSYSFSEPEPEKEVTES